MILHIQPVTDLLTITVYRKLFVMLHIINHQRDQLVWKLIRTVVVGAACDIDRHTVSVIERHNKVVCTGLAAEVQAVRIQRCGFYEVTLCPNAP